MTAKKEKVKYTNPWGILGHPTPEQIRTYMNMPHGEFRSLIGRLIKSKATVAEYDVDVTKTVSRRYTHTVRVTSDSLANAGYVARKLLAEQNFDFEGQGKKVGSVNIFAENIRKVPK